MIKKKLQISVFCDGGARGNPGPAATGFLIKDNKGKVLIKQKNFIGKATNNVAEYQAVIHALEWIINNKSFRLIGGQATIGHQPFFNFYLDSQLVVNQLTGKFKIKNLNLMALVIKIKNLEKQIKNPVFYHYIPREKNKQADLLVNQALDLALKLK